MWRLRNSETNSRLAWRENNFSFFSRSLYAPHFSPEWFLVFVLRTKTLNLSSSFVSRSNNSKNLLEGCWSCWCVETKPKTRTTKNSFGVSFFVLVQPPIMRRELPRRDARGVSSRHRNGLILRQASVVTCFLLWFRKPFGWLSKTGLRP